MRSTLERHVEPNDNFRSPAMTLQLTIHKSNEKTRSRETENYKRPALNITDATYGSLNEAQCLNFLLSQTATAIQCIKKIIEAGYAVIVMVYESN